MERVYHIFCSVTFFFGFFVTLPGFAQGVTTDSLQQLFQTTTNDSVKWETARMLAEEWSFIQTDSAFYWAKKSYQLASQMEQPRLFARSLYLMGAAASDKRDLPLAMEYFLKALGQFKGLEDERQQMETELEIGLIYQEMGEFDKARQHLDRFYQYYLVKGKDAAGDIIFALNQYVVLFEKMGLIDSMLHYAQATLDAAERHQQSKYLPNIHNNLASVYLYAKDYNKAKFHFQEAERIGFGENKIGRYYNFYALADMFNSLGQIDSSIFFSQKALQLALSFGDLEKETNIHRFLSNLYKNEEQFQKAYAHLDTFLTLSDSLTDLRYQEDLSRLSIQYETQEKEAQIARQELQLQRETNRRNTILFVSLLGLLLLGILIGYMYNRQQVQARKAAMELTLQQTEANKLRELDQLKSNFFANISHEFRTPLTLLLGPLRSMREGTFKEDHQSYLSKMLRQGERLLHLVNQMLDLSRLEGGQMEKQEQSVELSQFLYTNANFFESWADEKNIHLDIQLPPSSFNVKLDTDKLEKIISNLLSNALKFTPEGGKVTFKLIPLSETDTHHTIQLLVSDNGPGISADQLPLIFERFYQGATGHSHAGSGIGLALTKELVSFCNGHIEVESTEGEGASFLLTFLFEKTSEAEVSEVAPSSVVPLPSSEQSIPSNPVNREAPLVLIVEDNPDLRLYIHDQLKENYRILEAENGQRGLQLAKVHLPDLVISDVRMPKMDGLEFSTQLKTDEYTSHIPLIFLTALADQKNVKTGLATGADAYLTKPFDPEELQIRVFHLIEQRQKLRKKFAMALSEGPNTPRVENPADAAFLEKIKTVVFEHLDDGHFSIEQLGREVAMSRSQLHRKVKAITDQSPSIFVRTIRLQHAYKLLKEQQGNISEIAHEVGIPNLAQFSRSFKEQFGVPPSQI